MWPKQSEVLAYKSAYGDPRGRSGSSSSPDWEAKNLVYIAVPFSMKMGDINITRIRIHRHCAASLERILARLKDDAKGNIKTLREWGVTEFGGSFNYRPMRGLSTLSMHSFGCAIDLDPARNGLGDRTPRFAEFPQVLRAFKDEGWRWGGDWNGNGLSSDERRSDGMHFDAISR